MVSPHCKDRVIPFLFAVFLTKKKKNKNEKEGEGIKKGKAQGSVEHVLGGDSALSFLLSVPVFVGCAMRCGGKGQQLPTL